jgi:hypothetical protein
MTHQPPQPEASISPYPIQEPPHVENSPSIEVTSTAEDEAEDASEGGLSWNSRNVAGLVAAGVGVLGVASAFFFASRDKQSRSGAKPRKRTKAKAPAE